MPYSFSVITICLNNPDDLLRTMQSVDLQQHQPLEHIIIDGSNGDEIARLLASGPQPAYRYALHERDKGIADAFNKGIHLAKGEIILLLNAGDELADEKTLEVVNEAFVQNPSITWLHGKYWFKRSGIWVVLGKPYQRSKLYRGMRSICHQTMYVKKSVYDTYGDFAPYVQVCMDYDYLVRMRDEPFVFLKTILVRFAPGGISLQRSYQILDENVQVYRKHLGFSIWQWFWNIRLYILISLLNSPIGKWLYRIKVALKLENM